VEELMALSVDTECEIVSSLRRRIDVGNAGRLRLHSEEVYALALIRGAAGAVLLHVGLPAAEGGGWSAA
jgi:GntR family transcriptional regulator